MIERVLRIVELVLFIICLKFLYHENLKWKIEDTFLLLIEIIIFEIIYTFHFNHNYSLLNYCIIFIYLQVLYTTLF